MNCGHKQNTGQADKWNCTKVFPALGRREHCQGRPDEARLFISVLSLGEIRKGVAKMVNGRRKNALQHWLEHDLLVRFEGRILPFALDMALERGLVSAASESQGKPAPVVDILLVATGITSNLTLVTRNDKDFSGFPLKVLNPWGSKLAAF